MRYEYGRAKMRHLPMGEAPVPRKKSMCRIKKASKRVNSLVAVWMMAVKRRANPARPAFSYNEFKTSSVSGIRGIIARNSIVK